METSTAVVVTKFGGYDVVQVKPFPLPALLEDKVEIKVEYGGVNFADLYTRQGLFYDKKLPFVLGIECVGTITATGTMATDFKVGQRVICYDYQGGMYQETIRVSSKKCYPLPDQITSEEGATIFVNYLTAYFSIIELGHLQKNERILILSCGGGVGYAATQLAKTVENVKIFGTASAEKYEQVKANGVDVVLSLDEKFSTNIKKECSDGFDLILSNQSGPICTLLQTLLKPLGRIVLIGANNLINNEHKLGTFSLIKAWLGIKNVSWGSLITHNRVAAGLHLGTLAEKDSKKVQSALRKIFELLDEQKLKVKIDSVHQMKNVVEAMKRLGERKNVGKVLICMK